MISHQPLDQMNKQSMCGYKQTRAIDNNEKRTPYSTYWNNTT